MSAAMALYLWDIEAVLCWVCSCRRRGCVLYVRPGEVQEDRGWQGEDRGDRKDGEAG